MPGCATSGVVLPAASSHSMGNTLFSGRPLRYTNVPVSEKANCPPPSITSELAPMSSSRGTGVPRISRRCGSKPTAYSVPSCM